MNNFIGIVGTSISISDPAYSLSSINAETINIHIQEISFYGCIILQEAIWSHKNV